MQKFYLAFICALFLNVIIWKSLPVNGFKCPPLPGVGVKNGSYKVINRHTVRVLCNAGYYPVGREYLQCKNGKWNQAFATRCFPSENDCLDPPKIENGEVWGDDRNVGALVHYSCHEGYFTIGKGSRQCLPSLHWDGVTPLCLANANSPENAVKVLNEQLLRRKGLSHERALGKEVFENGMELIFLIDSSSSIDPVHFKKGLAFVTFILDVFGVNNGNNENGTRVALITFDEVAKLIFNLHDSEIGIEEAKEKLNNLAPGGGGTSLDAALTMVIVDVVLQGLRDKAKRVIFIITDALPTVASGSISPTEMSKHLKDQEKFEIFAAGVGKDVDKVLLSEIVSEPVTRHVFFLEKYTDFDKILTLIQNEPATTTSIPITPEQCGRPQKRENVTLSSSWLAAIYIEKENHLEFCSGVLICSHWVLTSSGCVLNKNSKTVNASQVFVTLGDYDLPGEEGNEINMYVTEIKLSPKLNGSANPYVRLALLKLYKGAPEDFAYQPVCLPQKSAGRIPLSMDLNTQAWLEGWGTSPNTFESKLLSAANLATTSKRIMLELVESSECRRAIRKNHRNERGIVVDMLMCAGIESGPTKCSGNLGSPLVARDVRGYYTVIGILAERHGCVNKHNVLVKVLPNRNWIYSSTDDCPVKHE